MKTTKMKEWARREVDLAKTWLNDEDLEAKETMSEEYEAAYRSYCNFLDEYEKLENTKIIKTVFTQLLHEEKFNEIYVQVRAGGLADFFQRLRLIDVVNFSDSSIIGSDIYQTEIVNNQVKQIAAFQRLLKSLALK